MFAGHYGVSLAAKKFEPRLPLWALFLAVQVLDILWAGLILMGVEKVNLVAGEPLEFAFLPYTHGLDTALLWSVVVGVLAWRLIGPARPWSRKAGLILGAAVFSHWLLDLVVHRADMPLVGNVAKVGFGLSDYLVPAFLLETLLLVGGLWLYLSATTGTTLLARYGMIGFVAVLIVVNASTTFGATPTNIVPVAIVSEVGYWLFAAVAFWLDRLRRPATLPGVADETGPRLAPAR